MGEGGEMSENSEQGDRGDVCILSDRRRASKGETERSWGEGAGVGGREERRRVSRTERERERGREGIASCCLAELLTGCASV